ncbi:MAG: diaminopimelate decarboxylase, partial [Candidatus Dormibacteria bacterium]
MRAISAPLGIGGVAAAELARCYGTPLLAFDTDRFDARLAELEALALGHRLEVAYAAKALLPVALAARLARSNLLLDVCSLGELIVAERARFPAARIVLH